MPSDDEVWKELPESPKDETWEELLNLTKNACDSSEQGVKKLEFLLYGSFLNYIKEIAAIHIKIIKGYLPDGDYVDWFVDSFIATKIIRYKALKKCNDVTHLKKRLWKAMDQYVKDTLDKDEAKILTGEKARKADRSELPFNTKYRDAYGNELKTLDSYTEKLEKTIIPRKIETTSLFKDGTEGDVKILNDIKEREEKSDENAEMMKEAMEQAYSLMYPISGKVVKLFFETRRLEEITRYEYKYTHKSKYNYKQIAELVNNEFPNANLSEHNVKERVTEKGKDLYKFLDILLNILRERKNPDEIKKIMNQISRHKKKDIKENKTGGENDE